VRDFDHEPTSVSIWSLEWKAAEASVMYTLYVLALLVGGVSLIALGIGSLQSLGSDVYQYFTGSRTNKAMWMLIGGSVLCVVGLTGLAHGTKANT
jgi:hypothetical protein